MQYCNAKYLREETFLMLYNEGSSSFGSMIRPLIDHCMRRCKYRSKYRRRHVCVRCTIKGSIKGLCVNGRQLREGWRHLSIIIGITLSISVRICVYLTAEPCIAVLPSRNPLSREQFIGSPLYPR